jgi:hypothetical protein
MFCAHLRVLGRTSTPDRRGRWTPPSPAAVTPTAPAAAATRSATGPARSPRPRSKRPPRCKLRPHGCYNDWPTRPRTHSEGTIRTAGTHRQLSIATNKRPTAHVARVDLAAQLDQLQEDAVVRLASARALVTDDFDHLVEQRLYLAAARCLSRPRWSNGSNDVAGHRKHGRLCPTNARSCR